MARETFTIEGAGAISLTAEAEGDAYAIPVLLAHGGGQTRRAWRRVVSELAQAGFRAIAFDMRGHGDSDWSPCGAYEMRDFAAKLPHATVVELPRAGHLAPMESPTEFHQAIRDWLAT